MSAARHLSPAEVIDLAEGGTDARARQHVHACAACRAELDGVVSMLATAGRDAGEEPSPLFWEHLPRRVADAIDAGAGSPPVPWWRRGGLRSPAALAAAAVLVVAVLTLTVRTGGRRPAVASAPAVVTVAVATDPAGVDPADAADPTWDVVTVLSAELDGDLVDPAMFEGAPGTVDRAVEGLSAAEQGELVRLLEEALAKRPS